MSKLYTEKDGIIIPKKRVLSGKHYWDYYGPAIGDNDLSVIERMLRIEGYYVMVKKVRERPNGYFIWRRVPKGGLVKQEDRGSPYF